MAVRDGDGYFTIMDRKKDMIVSGGFNVFPREIEDVLSAHSSLSAVAGIGVPEDKWAKQSRLSSSPDPAQSSTPRNLSRSYATRRDRSTPRSALMSSTRC